MRIGIFFGGQSREREVSFAGGRTVYDNLNKSIFEPVPIFVDSLGNFILLEWQYIYKGTIRDFYPSKESITNQELRTTIYGIGSENAKFQLYIESLGLLSQDELGKVISKVGVKITPEKFKDLFDFAFLTLHGAYGEDGNLQGILEWYGVPYSGSGILPSAIGVNKIAQNGFLKTAGFNRPKQQITTKKHWNFEASRQLLFEKLKDEFGFPFVIKSPNQGSSIGVSIIQSPDIQAFEKAVNKSFFIEKIKSEDWQKLSDKEKEQFIAKFTDIREGLGFPVVAELEGETLKKIYHPQELLNFLNQTLVQNTQYVNLTAENSEEFILFEQYLDGKEFSCIVIQDEAGNPIALPPTEIRKFNDLFDYRSKYLPGTSRKITPIEVESELIEEIRVQCCRLFEVLNCNVYARIDGFITKDNQIFLNDPNTTSGMLPSSFFFHQAAEIGLNSSNFLTYIIRTSLQERIKTGKKNFEIRKLLSDLDQKIEIIQNSATKKIKVAVIMGGYSTERHISMESGRNIYEKLASSDKYAPFPVFLTGENKHFDMYVLPINFMLKDNADDIRDRILNFEAGITNEDSENIIQKIIEETSQIRQKYAGSPLMQPEKINFEGLASRCEMVFIALHGRPGEDGALQNELEKVGLPYNGSGIETSQITINKYRTNEILKQNGICVAQHALVYKDEWQEDLMREIERIEKNFSYPLITKPADDGCSSAVKKIKNRDELIAFGNMMFRDLPDFLVEESKILQLKINEEFPQKSYFLIETLIEKGNAKYFLEVTGGLLTKLNVASYKLQDESCKLQDKDSETTNLQPETIEIEIFEPSETLAVGDVLSLEEKFLAGEGQNITPAVYSNNESENLLVGEQVKATLKKVAEILKIEGYARIDAFVKVYQDNRVETIIIEINSLPGMTPATCIFHQAAIAKYTPYQFIDAILEYGKGK